MQGNVATLPVLSMCASLCCVACADMYHMCVYSCLIVCVQVMFCVCQHVGSMNVTYRCVM